MRNPDWYSDTDPEALKVFIDLQRKMSPAQKIAGVFQMNEMLRQTTEGRERQLHPEASDREIFLRVAAHRLDRETMIRVYGWDPACQTCCGRLPGRQAFHRAKPSLLPNALLLNALLLNAAVRYRREY